MVRLETVPGPEALFCGGCDGDERERRVLAQGKRISDREDCWLAQSSASIGQLGKEHHYAKGLRKMYVEAKLQQSQTIRLEPELLAVEALGKLGAGGLCYDPRPMTKVAVKGQTTI